MSHQVSDQALRKELDHDTKDDQSPGRSPDSELDEKVLLRQASRRPRSFQQFWRGEWKEEERIPIWHNELRQTRRIVAKEWARTTLSLCVAILAILSIFWGFFLHTEKNLGSFVVWVVDFDGQSPYNVEPFVGPLVVQAAEAIAASKSPHLGFGSMPASFFHNNLTEVREAIYNYDAWAAIVINPNATALLRQAIESGNASYDPNGACQIIYVQTRDLSAHSTYIEPQLAAFQADVVAKIGTAWTKSVLQNPSLDIARAQQAPQALSPAIGFTTINLRPFVTPTATPSVTVGLIYIIILSFFSFGFFMPLHGHFLNQLEGHRKIYFGHLFIWKYISTVGAYFFMSLSYSLVSLAMQVPFSHQPASHVEVAPYANGYGKASFVVYWMINFVGMCALGLACENMAMILGNPWSALWLIFWVITNVPVSFYPIEIAPQFYYYGYAWPLHNIVEATKVVLFDVHSRIGLNFGILLTWWAVNTALFPVCAWWFRQVHLKNAHKRHLLKKLKIHHGSAKLETP